MHCFSQSASVWGKLLIRLRSRVLISELDHVVCRGVVFDRAFDEAVEYETDFRACSPIPSETELVEVLLQMIEVDAALMCVEHEAFYE